MFLRKSNLRPHADSRQVKQVEVRVRGISGAVGLDGDEGLVGCAEPHATRRQRDDSSGGA